MCLLAEWQAHQAPVKALALTPYGEYCSVQCAHICSIRAMCNAHCASLNIIYIICV